MRSVAEALSPDVKDLVWDTWKIRVTNNYAATEVREITGWSAVIFPESTSRRTCLSWKSLTSNLPVPAGVEGAKVLVTPLFNKTLPLFRYELSDFVAVVPGACPRLSYHATRRHSGPKRGDASRLSQRRQTVNVHAARLWFHLVRIAGIRQYQFVQLQTASGS